jgi:hypothetical protein
VARRLLHYLLALSSSMSMWRCDMKKILALAVAVFFFPVIFAQSIVAQNMDRGSGAPVPPASAIGPQLVAWSQMQTPHAVPQPMPQEQPDPQKPVPANPQAEQPQPASESFTGTIVKAGGNYVLKSSDKMVYEIDDQDRAKAYEGKRVKISGSVYAKTNLLHISTIDLLS